MTMFNFRTEDKERKPVRFTVQARDMQEAINLAKRNCNSNSWRRPTLDTTAAG